MDDLGALWCMYVLLFEDRPALAAQVYVRIQELRRQELYQALEDMEAMAVGEQSSNAQ